MDPFDTEVVRAVYNAVAEDYVTAFADDLANLPLDRSILDSVRERLPPDGLILDLGCGPGQVAQYFADQGDHTVGLDLASEMVHLAAQRTPDGRFVCGDMSALPIRSNSFVVVVGFYSIQHLPRTGLQGAISEIHRILVPDGTLVLATHLGDGEVVIDEFLDHKIEALGGVLYTDEELHKALRLGSFELDEVRYRDPLAHEYPSQRAYFIARARSGVT